MTRAYAYHRAGFDVQQAYDKFLEWCKGHPKSKEVMDFSTGHKSVDAAFAYWLGEIITVDVPSQTYAYWPMDTIPESAATTLVRIEVIVLQGILRAVLLSVAGIVLMPIAPFVVTVMRFRVAKMPWWWRTLMIPYWFSLGILLAVIAPFSALWRGLSDTMGIAAVEWRERWRNGTAKYPDGRPMLIPTVEQERLVDVAITKSVIEDYNEEARQHGQGIPPID